MKFNIYTIRVAQTVQVSFHETVLHSEEDILRNATEERRNYKPEQRGNMVVVNVETVEVEDKFKAWSWLDKNDRISEGENVLVNVFKNSNNELLLEYMLTGVWSSSSLRQTYKISELLEKENKKEIQFKGW